MTTTGRDINSINYRSINLVFVDSDKNILFCDTLSNNDYAIRNVEELEVYINDYLGGNLFLKTINLDDAYLYKLIPRYTKTYNKGIIDWNYDYNNIGFRRMNRLIKNLPITYIVEVTPDDDLSNSIDYNKNYGFIETFTSLYTYILEKVKNINSVYSFFYDNYAFDKKFIRRVILEEDTWRFNFIDSNVYEEKINYERKIMNDCGFKFNKKTNTWNKVK